MYGDPLIYVVWNKRRKGALKNQANGFVLGNRFQLSWANNLMAYHCPVALTDH